jgi:hypothetical protein
VRGTTGFDGLERISTQNLLDILGVSQRNRTAGTYRHLATLMAELGWAAVRVRDFTRGGYKEQVRGYARDARVVGAVSHDELPSAQLTFERRGASLAGPVPATGLAAR